MINTHISWWRRRLEEYPTDELPDQVVADHARESDIAEVVRRALDRLPQRMRTAVMLRYFEDMTEPEIAATLGSTPGRRVYCRAPDSWHYQVCRSGTLQEVARCGAR